MAYNSEQWAWSLGMGLIEVIGNCCMTIAWQNERSGFIILVGYIGLVYCFIGDFFVFNEKLHLLELLGVLVILTLNIALVSVKLCSS